MPDGQLHPVRLRQEPTRLIERAGLLGGVEEEASARRAPPPRQGSARAAADRFPVAGGTAGRTCGPAKPSTSCAAGSGTSCAPSGCRGGPSSSRGAATRSKNSEDLTDRQAAKLAWIAKHNSQLYRAYLLKEQLRLVFQHRGAEAVTMLDAWLEWARRSKNPAFIDLYRRIKKHRTGIIASVTHGLSNGLTESVNTKLRILTRIAYGFRSTDNLIALCLLDRGGHCPALPGRK